MKGTSSTSVVKNKEQCLQLFRDRVRTLVLHAQSGAELKLSPLKIAILFIFSFKILFTVD